MLLLKSLLWIFNCQIFWHNAEDENLMGCWNKSNLQSSGRISLQLMILILSPIKLPWEIKFTNLILGFITNLIVWLQIPLSEMMSTNCSGLVYKYSSKIFQHGTPFSSVSLSDANNLYLRSLRVLWSIFKLVWTLYVPLGYSRWTMLLILLMFQVMHRPS